MAQTYMNKEVPFRQSAEQQEYPMCCVRCSMITTCRAIVIHIIPCSTCSALLRMLSGSDLRQTQMCTFNALVLVNAAAMPMLRLQVHQSARESAFPRPPCKVPLLAVQFNSLLLTRTRASAPWKRRLQKPSAA